MQLTCPNCGAVYPVPDDAVGPNGRRVRCRACDTSWLEPPRAAAVAPSPTPAVHVPLPEPMAEPAPVAEPVPRRRRMPWLVLGLGVAVVALGLVAAMLLFGADTVAGRLGLAERRVPLGIAITRAPDWRLIAGGSQLFAVSGRVWNPTSEPQAVPDIRAELRDRNGRRVYAWTISRPVTRLAPGAAATFDGAAVDVPASSANVSVTFAGADGH